MCKGSNIFFLAAERFYTAHPIYFCLICPYNEAINRETSQKSFIFERAANEAMLTELLRKEHIARQVSVSDWESAIRYAGRLLVNTGSVEPRYVEQMVAISKESGPYIVIVPGVALAHARPSDGVNRLCMSLVTLAHPLEFGSADNDPVRVVIALAAMDNNLHLSALRELVQFIGSPDNIDGLCQCTSDEAILELFQTFRASQPAS